MDEKNCKFNPRASDSNRNGDTVFQDEGDDSPETFTSLDHQRLIKALSAQAYHLPGYTYWEDWKQYCYNNHPMFGICLHHKLHPIGWGMRALCFIASIVFGLVITNIVWMWAETLDDNSAVFHVDMGEHISQSVCQ